MVNLHFVIKFTRCQEETGIVGNFVVCYFNIKVRCVFVCVDAYAIGCGVLATIEQ